MNGISFHRVQCGEIKMEEWEHKAKVRVEGRRVVETIIVKCLRCGRVEQKHYAYSRHTYRMNG